MIRAKTEVSKYQDFWSFKYDKEHNMYLGTTKLDPTRKHNVCIAQNIMEVLRYEIEFYNGSRTFDTKDQWKIKHGLGGLNLRVNESKE